MAMVATSADRLLLTERMDAVSSTPGDVVRVIAEPNSFYEPHYVIRTGDPLIDR
jgi:hypothetical protein